MSDGLGIGCFDVTYILDKHVLYLHFLVLSSRSVVRVIITS